MTVPRTLMLGRMKPVATNAWMNASFVSLPNAATSLHRGFYNIAYIVHTHDGLHHAQQRNDDDDDDTHNGGRDGGVVQ